MALKERSYSALVVSSVENFNTAVSSFLPVSKFRDTIKVNNLAEAQRILAERHFDFVIINSPVGNDLALRFAIDSTSSRGAIVLFIINNEIHDEIYERVSPHGIFTLAKPISIQSMRTAVQWIVSAKELTGRFEKKTLSIDEKMQQIRLVNKAKWLLIDKESMTEPEAHRYIEKRAMDECAAKSDIANEIIKAYT